MLQPRFSSRRPLALRGVAASWLVALSLGACRRHHQRRAPGASASASASASPPEASVPEAAPPEDASVPSLGVLHQVGERVRTPYFEVIVKAVKECKARRYYRPNASDMWLGVRIRVEGKSAREVRITRFKTTLKDAAGHIYRPTLGVCEPELPNARLNQGDHAHGWITFEVPRATSSLTFRLDAFVIGAGHERLRFAVLR